MTVIEPARARDLPAWARLKAVCGARPQYAAGLFGADPGRGTRLAEACGIYLDYPRNLLNDEILGALLDLVR